MRLVGAVTLLLLQWSQEAESAVASSNDWGNGDTTLQLPDRTLAVSELLTDMSHLTLTAPIGDTATFGDIEITASMDKLAATGCQWDLPTLEAILKQSRESAASDANLFDIFSTKASILMKSCLTPENTEKIVQLAFDIRLYEIVRCLARYPIWTNEEHRHWFWAKLYNTNIVDPSTWNKQQFQWNKFPIVIFKADNAELYEVVRHEPSFSRLFKKALRNYIIKHDAVNILSNSRPEMIKELTETVDSIISYSPTRIINQIIPPRAVKSAQQLQRLFYAGYDQIPKFCLLSKDSEFPTIHPDCANWLIEHDCLPLFKEMCLGNPNPGYSGYCMHSIYQKNCDISKWLLKTMGRLPPLTNLMMAALRSGNLETVKWLHDDYKNRIDWNDVLRNSYHEIARYDFLIKFLKNKTGLASPVNLTLFFLAAEDNLEGLKATPPKTLLEQEQTAEIAAMRGNEVILDWVATTFSVLPQSEVVQTACERGNYAALHYIFKDAPSKIAPGYQFDSSRMTMCLLYASMQNNQDEMEWLLNNPLNDVKLTFLNVYDSLVPSIPEKSLLRIFNRISAEMNDIDQIWERVILWDHVQVLFWLRKKGQVITEEMATKALRYGQFKMIKAIYAIDPLLLCSEVAIEEVKKFSGLWKEDFSDLVQKACNTLG